MKKIISLVNQKGGTAKTSTCLALVSGLTAKGFKVLAIDLDPQGNFTFSLGIDRTQGRTAFDLLNGVLPIKDIAVKSPQGCYVIPSTPLLANADILFNKTGREYLLKEALEPIKKQYDYIIIDNPPHLGVLVVNALTASTNVIIPTGADVYSLQGIGDLAETLKGVTKYTNTKLKIDGLLITKYNGRRTITKTLTNTLNQYADILETKILGTIREGVAITEAELNRVDLLSYDPNSKAILDYKDFVNQYVGDKAL